MLLSRLNDGKAVRTSEEKICRSLLKMYEKKYLLDPTAAKVKIHVPAVDFSKQSYRNSFPNKSFNLESESSVEHGKDILFTKKIRGLIPMSKQLARKPYPTPHYGPTYHLNYSQVFPKIQIKVDYEKQAKFKQGKGRIPLIIPLLSRSTVKNKSLIF